MKLDRNINPDGRGKYALVKMREVPSDSDGSQKANEIREALSTLARHGCLDYGDAKENDFFVLRLRDVGAAHALRAYAEFFRNTDPEWFDEIKALADKSYARFDRKMPD